MENLSRTLFFIWALLPVIGFGQATSETKLANEYFFQGDDDKAEEMFEKLSRNRNTITEIHANYLALLIDKPDLRAAEHYLEKVLKFYPDNLQYQSDLLYVKHLSENEKAKHAYLQDLLKKYDKNQYQLNIIAQHLVNRELPNEAIQFLMKARRVSGNPRAFALDLAAIYRMKNDKASMTEEYLNYAMINPGNTNYIKNIFQVLMSGEEDLDFLERTLIRKVQQQPDQMVYAELLIWVELQRKNFYGAFMQARAVDKRLSKPGDESMRIGKLAMDNAAWEDAIEIFSYVIDEHGNAYHYANARQLKIQSAEQLVKSRYPVDPKQIRNLTNEYHQLYEELGPTPISLDALRNKALLHAFYLREMDSAISILNEIITTPRISERLISGSKLNLGDIYLLIDEPWEASLLYSQVEKSNKYSSVGYEAKLKNAKLHYFTGNFALANSHLSILKRATTKKISNDAIDLGLLINNNTVFDTTDEVMQNFANIELLRYQNQDMRAKGALIELIEKNPSHSLVDEANWLLADLELKAGNFNSAIVYLDNILASHSEDILGDDAFFRKSEIFDRYLNDEETAQTLYREFIDKYPGSKFSAEARRRFRELRGDFIN